MIGLDTNVLVRYIVQDDPKQSRLATRRIESLTDEAPGYVGIVAVIELNWVLVACYGAGRQQISQVLRTLLQTRCIVVAKAEAVWRAVRLFEKTNADFTDALLKTLAEHDGCSEVVTFDRNAARQLEMRLLAD
jgi:predicted nucleic-acid-binding protein